MIDGAAGVGDGPTGAAPLALRLRSAPAPVMRKLPVPVCVTVPGALRARLAALARAVWPKRPRSAWRSDAPSRFVTMLPLKQKLMRPALLADHDHDRVGLLGDAEGRAVARAERLVEDLGVGHREEHAGLRDRAGCG